MQNANVVRLTSNLVNIKSESEKEGEDEVSKYINEYLQNLGIKSEISAFETGRSSVTASIGEGEGLMLNGHTDTVPIGAEKYWKYGTEAKAVNGKLYGRGTSDMKGGIAAILSAISGLNFSRAKRRLVLTFVADEEVKSRGSEWLIKHKKELFRNVKLGIIAEPTDMNLQVAQKGHVEIGVTVKGISAHGSMPNLGRNAIVDMSKFMVALDKFQKNLKQKDKILGKGTINIGTIRGGQATNVVPDLCEVKIDRRLVPGETGKIAVSQIKKILDSLDVDYSISPYQSRPPFKLDEKSRIVKFLSSIIPTKHTSTTGYTEAELYNSMAKIECVVFGPGTKKIIHKPNEYVSIANLTKSQNYYSKIIDMWCFGNKVR